MQFVADVHDTELNSAKSPDAAGSRAVNAVHFPPVHCSASGARLTEVLISEPPVPTATQSFTAGQDTPLSRLSCSGLAVVWSDQALPFQCAASALPPLFVPTAVQFPVAGQATNPPSSALIADQQGHIALMQVSGRTLTAIQRKPTEITIDQVSAANGAVVKVLYRHTFPFNPNLLGPMIGDPSGQYLMVWYSPPSSGWLRNGAFHKLPANLPYPNPYGFAW